MSHRLVDALLYFSSAKIILMMQLNIRLKLIKSTNYTYTYYLCSHTAINKKDASYSINIYLYIFNINKASTMIFFNRSNKSKHKDFNSVRVDMHSHLIPGVDDGAKDVSDSIQIISGLKELGFSKLFTTPHTLQDIHPNNHETLKKGHDLLYGYIPKGISLELSSEYYIIRVVF
jgi:hypothetical protein